MHLQNLKQYEGACQKQTFMNTVLESKPSTYDGIAVNENWKITPKKINKIMVLMYHNWSMQDLFLYFYFPSIAIQAGVHVNPVQQLFANIWVYIAIFVDCREVWAAAVLHIHSNRSKGTTTSSEYCWIQVLKVSHSGRRAEIYSYTAVFIMFVVTGINCSRNTRINGIII